MCPKHMLLKLIRKTCENYPIQIYCIFIVHIFQVIYHIQPTGPVQLNNMPSPIIF